MLPEPSAESKAADEQAFAASMVEGADASDARQQQAEAFQTAGNTLDVPNVLAGQERH